MSWLSEKRLNQLSYGTEVLYRSSSWFNNESAWELKRDDIRKSCLLLIDCQNKYKIGSDLPKCTENIAKIARFFASEKLPIYWTKYNRYMMIRHLHFIIFTAEERKGNIIKAESLRMKNSRSYRVCHQNFFH